MKLSANQRRALLGVALTATLMAVVSANQLERETRPAKSPAVSPVETASKPEAGIPLEKLRRPAERANAVDVFVSKSWYVPPPPAKALPPPPPLAPPLPFTYMGKLLDAPDRVVVFLVRGDRVYTVSPGDVIDDTYRVEALAGGQLTLTYLPLDIKQTLNIGNDS